MENLSVYFDSNVIIDMCDGSREGLKNKVLALANSKLSAFPFSSSHVAEITVFPLSTRCSYRLNFLSELSKNFYIVHSIHEYAIKLESPLSVYETINEALPNLNINKLFANVIPHDLLIDYRNKLGLSTVELNNLSGSDAVEIINNALKKNIPSNIETPRSMEEMLEFCKGLNRENFSAQYANLGVTEEHMSYDSDLQFIFNILDLYGYWPDNKAVYEKGSRFTDQLHIFYAKHFELFVTNDKAMKHRAEAAFSILKIKTKVLFTREYEEILGVV